MRATVLAISLFAAHAPTHLGAQPDPRAAAVAQARAGDHAGALAALESLAAQRPDDRAIAFDRIVILGWAGRDAEALALAGGLDIAGAPPWVLEAIGRSARNQKRFDLARSVYQRSLQADPGRAESRLGLAFSMSDLGDHAGAARLLDQALAASPTDARLLEARARVAEYGGDWLGALVFHQRALKAEPQRRESLRGVVRAAGRLGAPHLAADLAARHPGLLTEAETAALQVDAAALQVRWARVEERIEAGEARFGWADRALSASEPAARRLAEGARVVGGQAGGQADGQGFSEADRRLLADRLEALQVRRRPVDTVALYRDMRSAGLPVPGYARSSVADALLELRRPDEAATLYRESLAEQPGDFDLSLALFFALIESERIDEATAHVDALAERTPRWQGGRGNHDAVTARTAQALARLYGDRLAEAERRSGALRAELPYNAQVREAHAAVLLARGWPRLADEEFRRAGAVDPASAGLRAQRVAPLLDVHAWDQAQAELRAAEAIRPDDHRVRRAADLWAVHRLRELDLSAEWGTSGSGAPTGSDDWRVAARLYTRPLATHWRLFGQATRARAEFDTGVARWHREGIGAEYRARDVLLGAALTDGSSGRTGLEAAAAWQPDDHWSLTMSSASVSSNVPLQAWNAGVCAGELGVGARYAVNESRSFGAGLSRMDFSDGNDRDQWWVSWSERWLSEPRWRVESTASLGGSENSLAGAPYFNPGSDLTASVELAGEWLNWRRYERQFRQRVALTLGRYAQEGFGSGSILGASYEHVWELDRRLYLRYGVGRSLRPYDGERTGRTVARVELEGRF
jgi:biofilm PGA synthesis protein PgaA